MPIPSINTTNSVSPLIHASIEQPSDLDILREVVPLGRNPSTENLYRQKSDIFDKLTRERPINTTLDLSKIEMMHANLSARDLCKINFSAANLSYTNLSEANLVDCDFSKTKLDEANLHSARMDRSVLKKAQLSKTEMNGVVLVDADLSQAYLSRANLTQANLANVNLDSAILAGANFTNAKLNNAKLIGVNLVGANFTGAVLDGAELRNIAFPAWNDEYVLHYFNPSRDYFSLQKTIDSIDPKYNDQKIVLMHELLDFLDTRDSNISLLSMKQPLLDILLKTPYN